jgi:hypothetical protein
MKKLKYSFCFVLLLTLMGCHQSASDVTEAAEMLTNMPKWQLSEIQIDNAPVFKEGKQIPHFSGIVFDNYMDWVRFLPDGTFEGHFKDAASTQKFQWEAFDKRKLIALRDTVAKTGGWNIYTRYVYDDAFEMETISTVYDPPRKTKVTLKFKKM